MAINHMRRCLIVSKLKIKAILIHHFTPTAAAAAKSLRGSAVKKIHLQCRRPGFDPWVGVIPWRRERLPTPVFWPGKFHELYGPSGHKESDTTERLSFSSHLSGVQLFATYRLWPSRLLCPWDYPAKNTGVGYHALLQGIFLTQGSNLCLLWLLHCRWIFLTAEPRSDLGYRNTYWLGASQVAQWQRTSLLMQEIQETWV